MNVLFRLGSTHSLRQAYAITFGNFDGVHLGHQALLREMTALARLRNLSSVVITFSPHPATILKKQQPALIYPSWQNLSLLEKSGLVDEICVLEFDTALSHQTAEQFLVDLKHVYPFALLFLGEGASFGHARTGISLHVQELAKKHAFELVYHPLERCQNRPVSSSHIRHLIQKGALSELPYWLGRPYGLSLEKIPGKQQGRKMGFPTLNFSVQELVLPPFGVYAVTLDAGQGPLPAIANLGIAPTLYPDRSPLLEVHILSDQIPTLVHRAEVTFSAFLRPEKKFDTLESLQAQIRADIALCRQIHAC